MHVRIEKIKKYQEIKKQLGVKKPVIKVQAIWPSISQNVEEFYNIFNPITDQIASNPLIDWLFMPSNLSENGYWFRWASDVVC